MRWRATRTLIKLCPSPPRRIEVRAQLFAREDSDDLVCLVGDDQVPKVQLTADAVDARKRRGFVAADGVRVHN